MQGITNSYMQVVKHKAGLVSTIPNSTILHHQIYNLRNLTDIQTQNHISSLHTQLNNTLTAPSIKIIIQHLQNATLSSNNILLTPNYILPTKFHNTLTAQTIQTAHQLNIYIENLPNPWPIPTIYKGTPIDTLIKFCNKPTHIKSLTNKANIYAIEQLTNHTNTQLVPWQCIAYKTLKIPRGRTPKWFLELHNTFYASTTPFIPTITPNPFTTNSIILKRSTWVLGKTNKMQIIGKIQKIIHTSNTIYIKHYCLPPPELQYIAPLSKCMNCKNTITTTNQQCIIMLKTFQCTAIKVSSAKFLRTDIDDLVQHHPHLTTQILSRHQHKTPTPHSTMTSTNKNNPQPSITSIATNNLIHQLFLPNTSNARLSHLSTINSQAKKLQLYLHATIIQPNTPSSQAQFAWILTPTNITFSSQITHWPSITRAYLIGIITILTIASQHCQITVFMTHKSTTNYINSLLIPTSNTTLTLQKHNHWPLKLLTQTIIARKHLKIKCINIENPDNHPLYNRTVHLSTTTQQYKLHIQPHALDNNNFYLTWNGTSIENKTHHFIRHLQNATNTAKWHALNRTSHWNIIRHNTNWDLTYQSINYNNKPNTRATHPKHSQLKSFKIKFLLNELPTLLNLHYRKPKTYTNPTCNRCTLHIEDNLHWLECQANSITLNQLLQQTIHKFCTKHKIGNSKIPVLLQQFTSTQTTTQHFLRIQGLIPDDISTNCNITSSLLVNLFHKISNNIYKQIWTERCKAVHQNNLLTNTLTVTAPEHPVTDQAAKTKYEKWANIFSTTNISTSYIATLNLEEV
jgi:hypothetical protein